jgi:hypothetical protein
MAVTCYSETSVDFQRIAQRYILEDRSLQSERRWRVRRKWPWPVLRYYPSTFLVGRSPEWQQPVLLNN